MDFTEILRRHAAALLHDVAAELEGRRAPAERGEAEPDSPRAAWPLPEYPCPYDAEYATCRNCGHPVSRRASGNFRRWLHGDLALELYGRAGCRAASFDRLGEWDDSLHRGWVAEPAR
jgi:hypothetical protein